MCCCQLCNSFLLLCQILGLSPAPPHCPSSAVQVLSLNRLFMKHYTCTCKQRVQMSNSFRLLGFKVKMPFLWQDLCFLGDGFMGICESSADQGSFPRQTEEFPPKKLCHCIHVWDSAPLLSPKQIHFLFHSPTETPVNTQPLIHEGYTSIHPSFLLGGTGKASKA